MEKRIVVFADERAKNLLVYCPLCREVFHDPYITSCGHTFCSTCISNNNGQSVKCPVDKTNLTPVVKNIAVFEQVGELLVHCQYGCRLKSDSTDQYEADPDGCQSVMQMCDKEQHELQCDHRPVQCPNSSECGEMSKKELEEHLKTCQYLCCPHQKYGCNFRGGKDVLEKHLLKCDFEGVKGYLQHLDSMVTELKDEIQGRDRRIEELLTVVSDTKEQLEKQASLSSKRIEHLEEQQSQLFKDLRQASTSVDIFMSKLNHVELQLGLNAYEPQHLFKCHGTFVGHKGPVWKLCTSGNLLFSASSDNTIKVWNVREIYEGPKTLTGHDGIVLAVCTRGDLLYSGGSDKTIKVWDTKTLKQSSTIQAHDDPVCTLAISSTKLFSGSLKSIKVWTLSDHHLVKTMPTQNHWVRALVATDQFLYSGSYKSVKIWSMDSLEVSHVLYCNGGSVYSLAISDKHIICGTYENMIHVWDKETLADLASLSGHFGTVYDLAILQSPGQVRLFSGSYDKTIRVWNMELLTCAQTMSRHEGSVTSLTISRGAIYSAAVDGTVKVWH